MIAEKQFTLGEFGEQLRQKGIDVSQSTLRRILDSFDAEIPRVGQTRAIPASLIERIQAMVEKVRTTIEDELTQQGIDPTGASGRNLLKLFMYGQRASNQAK